MSLLFESMQHYDFQRMSIQRHKKIFSEGQDHKKPYLFPSWNLYSFEHLFACLKRHWFLHKYEQKPKYK